MDLPNIKEKDYLLIAFSQGLSPNMIYCLYKLDPKNIILITSVNQQTPNAKKVDFLLKIKNSSLVFNYPKENPDNTLIRVTGPYVGFCIALLLKRVWLKQNISAEEIQAVFKSFKAEINRIFSSQKYFQDEFIERLAKTNNIVICCDTPAINLIDNIRYKII